MTKQFKVTHLVGDVYEDGKRISQTIFTSDVDDPWILPLIEKENGEIEISFKQPITLMSERGKKK